MRTRDWERLGRYVASRRKELGYERQDALARVSGVSTRTISSLENGNTAKPWTLNKIEDALGWVRNSWEAITEGGEPRLVAPVPQPTLEEIDEADRAIVTATHEQLVDMYEMIRETLGRLQAKDFLVKALRLRETSQRGESACPAS